MSEELKEIGITSEDYTIFARKNEAGGTSYWSDEIGGGVLVWDTALVSQKTLEFVLAHYYRALTKPIKNG